VRLPQATADAVLAALPDQGATLPVLAALVGLSSQTVGWALADLMDAELVTREAVHTGRRGRPSHRYSRAPTDEPALPPRLEED
jgi:predicted ArsR family transcriptional regulator